MTIKQTNLTIRPKLGRSCRCMKIQGRGYESVVDCVSMSIPKHHQAFCKKELRIRVKLGKSLHFTFFHSKNVVRKIVVQKLRKRKCLNLSLAILLYVSIWDYSGQIVPYCPNWTKLSILDNIVHIGKYCPYWTILSILDHIVHI